MARLLQALDTEWRTIEHGADGVRSLSRWAEEDDRYTAFTDLAELRAHFERRDVIQDRDSLMADLLRRSPDDGTARRVLFAALRPGLVRLSNRAAAFWERDDAESIVIASALERLLERREIPAHIAAGVLGSVWSSVWARRSRERREEEFWGSRTDPEALDLLEAVRPDDALTRLLQLVDEAVRRGALPTRGARLMLLHWVHGYSTSELADIDGLRPCTIRKHRRDAEVRLAAFAA